MAATRSVEDYLDQAYSISLSRAEDGQWVATVDELAGCEARGSVPEEAAARVHEAMGDWIAAALADGKAVPEPRAGLSGRLLVRMPRTLHADLARAAAREQVSLNQFITGALSTAVAWRGSPPATPGPAAPPTTTTPADEATHAPMTRAERAAASAPAPAPDHPEPVPAQSSFLRYALVANFVLVAIAAVVAIVLLASGG
jgi:antitoxin HicB